jgi:hypothetical protein
MATPPLPRALTSRGVPLRACWNVTFERMPPVQGFPSSGGNTSGRACGGPPVPGEYVGYESWLERDCLMALDADPDVVTVALQPMWRHWAGATGRAVRHAPATSRSARSGRGWSLWHQCALCHSRVGSVGQVIRLRTVGDRRAPW